MSIGFSKKFGANLNIIHINSQLDILQSNITDNIYMYSIWCFGLYILRILRIVIFNFHFTFELLKQFEYSTFPIFIFICVQFTLWPEEILIKLYVTYRNLEFWDQNHMLNFSIKKEYITATLTRSYTSTLFSKNIKSIHIYKTLIKFLITLKFE